MSSKIPFWELSQRDRNMYEFGTAEQIAKALAKKNRMVTGVFDSLTGKPGENTEQGLALARLTPDQKQQMILQLSLAADFEGFSGDRIKVGVSMEPDWRNQIGGFVYILQSDSVTQLKEKIRKYILNGEEGEMILREGCRGGDVISPVRVQMLGMLGDEGRVTVVTGDSTATMLSLGFKDKFLDVRLRMFDR